MRRRTRSAPGRIAALILALCAWGQAFAITAVSSVIEGPDVINSLVDRVAHYQVRVYYSDGTDAIISPVGISTSSGSTPVAAFADTSGTLNVLGPGMVTLSYDGWGQYPQVPSSKTVSVQNVAPSNLPFDLDCGTAESAILADYAVAHFMVGPARDLLPLCASQVLLASSSFNRIEALDVVTGRIHHSWQLTAAPQRMARIKGTPYLFVSLNATQGARIDLTSDAVSYFTVPGTSYSVVEGEPGEVWYFTSTGTLRFDVASLQSLGNAGLVASSFDPVFYDRLHQRAFMSGVRFTYSPATHALTYSGSVGGPGAALSPNGLHLAAPAQSSALWDFDTADLTQHFGVFDTGYYPGTAADFRFDGRKLLATNRADILMFDVATHVRELSWNGHVSYCDGDVRLLRWSPLARNFHALSDCNVYGTFQHVVYGSLPAPVALFVQKAGGGAGLVAASPGQINCGDDCADGYAAGTTVTLSATPAAGSTFDGWTGCPSAASTQCTITLTGAATITARFKGGQTLSLPTLASKTYGDAPFTVTATSSSGLPVTLVAGPPSTCTLSANIVTLVGIGTCTVTASQGGDANYNAAADLSRAFAVLPVSPTVTLTSSANPASLGVAVTFRSTVAGNGLQAPGNVRFKDGTTVLCDVALAAGSAQCVAQLPAGTHSVVAEYPGAANFNAATSTAVAQLVRVLDPSASSITFPNESMGTTSAVQTLTFTNNTPSTVTVTAVTASPWFSQTNDCAVLAPGASCQVRVTFTPLESLALNQTASYGGSVTVIVDGGAAMQSVALSGIGEMSLVRHYYRSILRREPDSGGLTFWQGEAARVAGRGANVNEAWYSMSMQFFGSPEYSAFARDNAGYVTDLYRTFFNRDPDGAGLAFWTDLISRGLVRESVLSSFMFSPEFAGFTRGIFGSTAARAEVDVVMDFYRGFLGRLPDNSGFDFWVSVFRSAQCSGANAVYTQADSISASFANSTEYRLRSRSNVQYVSDLYNAFMRRGPDLDGLLFWKGQLDTGRVTREQLRKSFLASPEFSQRVNAVVSQGCM